jgi:hypothetical protein
MKFIKEINLFIKLQQLLFQYIENSDIYRISERHSVFTQIPSIKMILVRQVHMQFKHTFTLARRLNSNRWLAEVNRHFCTISFKY